MGKPVSHLTSRSRPFDALPLRLILIGALCLPALVQTPVDAAEATAPRQGTVEFTDGGSITGLIVEELNTVIVKKGGGSMRFPRSKVASIKYAKGGAVEGAAALDLLKRIEQLEKRIAELEKRVQELNLATPAPASPYSPGAPVPSAGPAPVPSAGPAPVPSAGPAPVPAAAPAAPAAPASGAAAATIFPALMDQKAMKEFVPYVLKHARFRTLNSRGADKHMEGVLNRYAVMSRDIGQRALLYPTVGYESGKRLVVIETTVVFTNKRGGGITDAWLEDSARRRHPLPTPRYGHHWRNLFRYSYSEVDRYFVEPLCGGTLRKYISYPYVGGSRVPDAAFAQKQNQEARAGLGFFVPENARSLYLRIAAVVPVEKTVVGGNIARTVSLTQELLTFKLGDILR